ncbi:acyloxyacyl hydrolase [Ramlibacter sp. PS4R-6]|uniref:acyloxyacyl hydrolase n=1 Tax=Ramlibacter sp. PS4R-6 TaxID=3133438 RepID=UPI0030B0DD99
MHIRSLLLAAATVCTTASAAAADRSFFIAPGGFTAHGTSSLTAGVAWPLDWRYAMGGVELGAQVEGFASLWRAPQTAGGNKTFVQLGLLPVLRARPGAASPFFAEMGIGLSYTDDVYVSRRKTFSTRFNFYDMLGVGVGFGAQREHEVGVRFVHISNAGIKRPNPGENFVLLRYAHSF